jgi:hypothetical protein
VLLRTNDLRHNAVIDTATRSRRQPKSPVIICLLHSERDIMAANAPAQTVLDRHYLELRCGILDLAAMLDRVERSPSAAAQLADSRMDLIRKGIEILLTRGTDRAERVQLLYSDQYIEGWNRPK